MSHDLPVINTAMKNASAELIDPSTWATLSAMERSHTWRVTRHRTAEKACTACGDTLASQVRYCPGAGSPVSQSLMQSELPLEGPTLENPQDRGVA